MLELQKIFLIARFFNRISFNKGLKVKIFLFFLFSVFFIFWAIFFAKKLFLQKSQL